MMRALFLAIALIAAPSCAEAQTWSPWPTWIMLGDSIQSFVPDGTAADLDTTIIERERNISIIRLVSPGETMNRADALGFNSTWTTDAFDHICGLFSACSGVIIQAGINWDGNWDTEAASINRVITWARSHQKRVLMLDLIWHTSCETHGPFQPSGLTCYQHRLSRALACAWNSDVCTFAPRPPQFDVSTPSLYNSAEVGIDLTHPNAAGHRVMATWIEQAAASAGMF